jgi:hypothetical protein
VQKFFAALAFVASIPVIVVVGCKHSTTQDDTPVETGPDGSPTPGNADCSNVAPVNSVPDCDQCVRSQRCCPAVLDCDNSSDCKALQDCLSKCAPGDTACSENCRTQHEPGSGLLALVSQCAEARCSAACGVEVVVGDGG